MELYYRGHQQISMTVDNNSFDVYDQPDFYVENQFRKHVDTVVQVLNKSEGDILVRPGSDSPQDIATARVADQILEMMLGTIGYEKLKTQKNLFKCLFGNAFIFTDYVVDKKYGTVVTPKYGYSEVPSPDNPEEMLMTKVAEGTTTRNRGSEVAAVCSPLEINCLADVRDGVTALPYLQWISRPDRDVINYLYPGLNEGGTMSAIEQDLATQYLDILGNLPGNVLGDGLAYNRTGSMNKMELVRTWAEPCTFRGDKELEREFPDGAHITTVNGRVIDFYPEHLADRWTHEVLIPNAHQMLGDGLFDAILLQDQLNEMNSLFIQHMRYTTVSHKVYDVNIIDPKNVVNDPKNGWIPGSPSVDKRISDSVFDIPPNQLSPDTWNWRSTVLTGMQDMTSAYDPVTGKGLGANTPYSQSVFLAERAQSRWQGSLAYNRPELIRFHRQLLEIAKNNWIDERSRAIADNTGAWSFQQFSQADMQGSVDINLTNTDFKPRSRAEQIQGLQMLTTLMPLLPMMPPRQKLRIEEMLGLPPNANPMSTQVSRALRNIDRIKKGEPVTPLPMVDDAMVQIPVYADWLASEEGEAIAETTPEIYANVYTLLTTLTMMGLMHMQSPASQLTNPQQNSLPGGKGEPPAQKGQPGGQLGQQGGGSPNPDGQAQSPAAAPPIPPSEANNRGEM
jgi:hypothetical protein